jgi:hypothetical protein
VRVVVNLRFVCTPDRIRAPIIQTDAGTSLEEVAVNEIGGEDLQFVAGRGPWRRPPGNGGA